MENPGAESPVKSKESVGGQGSLGLSGRCLWSMEISVEQDHDYVGTWWGGGVVRDLWLHPDFYFLTFQSNCH